MEQEQYTLTAKRSFRHSVVVAFGWLFVALAMLALLSPPGASHDELYHATSIWCAYGERDPYCERDADAISGGYARTNIDVTECKVAIERPLICPTEGTGRGAELLNISGQYPSGFHKLFGVLVVPNYEFSFVLIRVFNALITVALLGVSIVLFPNRYRVALVLMMLSLFNPFVFYLLASLNPSSWAVLGVGVGWMAVHAVAVETSLSTQHRIGLMILALVFTLMAAISRWDSAAFVLFTLILTLALLIWSRFQGNWKLLAGSTMFTTALSVALVDRLASLSFTDFVRLITTYTDGEPDNLAFFTHHFLQTVPRAIEALGSVPSHSVIYIHQVVGISGLVVLFRVGASAYSVRSHFQVIGVAATVILSLLVATAWQALVDNRDTFNPETRYVLPLTAFAVGWFYVFGREDLSQRIQKHLHWMAIVVTIAFGLSIFSIAERNVDYQTFGIRLIPEGPDQWWWSWMPIGPNVVVLISVLSMWRFLRRLPILLTGPDAPR